MSTIEHIQAILDAAVSLPLKDSAGIIIPAHVDARHQAAGMRRIINALEEANGIKAPRTNQKA